MELNVCGVSFANLQVKQNDVWSPVAFFSRRLNAAQQNYSAFDRELLAAYSAVKHFLYFIECTPFVLFADHKPLVKAFSQKSAQSIPRRARQMAFIAEFTSDLKYMLKAPSI